jgi:hypothetical protein
MASSSIMRVPGEAKLSLREKLRGESPIFWPAKRILYLGNPESRRDWGYAPEYGSDVAGGAAGYGR